MSDTSHIGPINVSFPKPPEPLLTRFDTFINLVDLRFLNRDLQGQVVESYYSGDESNLLQNSTDVYVLSSPVHTIEERRYPRISCRNAPALACIKTDQGTRAIVNMINVSRGGVCFTSLVEFYLETRVSIATYYMDGGQNIFQDGRIVRVQSRPSSGVPGEYAIEFSGSTMHRNIPGPKAKKPSDVLLRLLPTEKAD